MKKVIRFISLVLLIALLAACAPAASVTDAAGAAVAATQAAQTIQARLTEQLLTVATLPAVVSPTGTVAAVAPTALTAAAQPGGTPCADAATFVADITIPDGTVMAPSQVFTKTWRLKNSGTCAWTTAYTYALEEGPVNAFWTDTPHPLPVAVEPGQTVDISVNLTAPAFSGGNYSTNGTNEGYTASYQLYNAAGAPLLEFSAVIKVQEGSAGGFAVTNVTYAVSTWSDLVNGTQYTDCPLITANIAANGAGTVDYHWVGFASQSPASLTPLSGEGYSGSLTFDAAGVKSVSQRWTYRESTGGMGMMSVGDSGGIFIDAPNNQAFGGIFLPVCSAP